MKAIITIIILALVAWGLWTWWDGRGEPAVNGQEAQVSGALNDLLDSGTGTSTDSNAGSDENSGYNDKG